MDASFVGGEKTEITVDSAADASVCSLHWAEQNGSDVLFVQTPLSACTYLSMHACMSARLPIQNIKISNCHRAGTVLPYWAIMFLIAQ